MNNVIDKREEKILALLNEKTYTPMTLSELAFLMQVPKEDNALFAQLVDGLIGHGKVVFTKKGKLILPEKLNMVGGVFVQNAKGFGFVVSEGEQKDTFIPANSINGAMHKDTVLVRVTDANDGRPEGEIVKILERGVNLIVGTFENGFVMPDDRRIGKDVFIRNEDAGGAVDGHKVVVKITKWPEQGRNPAGQIIEILGHTNDPGVDVLSIARQFDLPVEFSQDTMQQVEAIPHEVLDWETKGRENFENLPMITIDGEDAKDIDDAISLGTDSDGNFLLGVHIADVAHYVAEKTPLDKDAYTRGTSAYLTDRVIPMLPHKLSNGICSLNARVRRLALSCMMTIDRQGNVLQHKIFNAVINVDRRMTYTIVNDILKNELSEYASEFGEFVNMLKQMETLRNILRRKRVKRGAIEFEFTESKIILDDFGKPIDIKPQPRNIATSIIEEFMLVCNETVAEDFFWQDMPFLYRSHAEPDGEKIQALSVVMQGFGHGIKGAKKIHSKDIQKLLKAIEDTPEETIISRLVLRSFKQARYTYRNEGHFGLAAKYYCHFTAPIRRYPDLQIHRIIKESISGGIDATRQNRYKAKLPEVARHTSVTERNAEEAEREVTQLKKVQYMTRHIGKIFEGIISGVTSWGIYVELENTVEGMVHVSNLDDDYYIFNESKMLFEGERTGKVYRLGDRLSVKVVRADEQERKIDFSISRLN